MSLEFEKINCPLCGCEKNELFLNAFEKQLAPLIERAQNGATHHRGKSPRRAGSSIDRTHLIRQLSKELDQAVAAEQYERAAKLRDRLRSLDTELSASAGGDPGVHQGKGEANSP